MARGWSWIVRGYYADDVAPPKRPGDLAIEVGTTNRGQAEMDEAVLRGRPDIGEVELIEVID